MRRGRPAEAMEGNPLEVEEGSNHDHELTSSPPGEEAETPQIPPHGSGERLGFLLGVNSPSSSTRGRGAKECGLDAGLPPVDGTRSSRKRGRAPPIGGSSSGRRRVQEKGKDGETKGKHVQKKSKHADVHEHPQKSPSPMKKTMKDHPLPC